MTHISAEEFIKRAKSRAHARSPKTSEIFHHSDQPQTSHPSDKEMTDVQLPVQPHIRQIHKPPSQSSHQHLKHSMSFGEKVRFVILRSIGNFLVLFSLYGVVATFGPALMYEVQYQIIKTRGINYTVAEAAGDIHPVTPGFGDVLAGAQQQVLIPPDTQFSIVIPKIGATSKVYPNIDPTNEQEFLPKLQTGVAHAKGTVFPGFEGNTYIFAHSTDNFWNVGRYNAVFYLLKELQPGDEIIVFFEDRKYNYVVERTEIKDADDVELLVNSQKPGEQQLILQTCWPPGTTWKRLFVIATPQNQ